MQVAVTCFVCLKAVFLTDQHIEIWSVCWNRHLAHVAYGAQEITCFRPQQLLFSYIVSAEQLFTVIKLCLVQPKNFVRLKLCHAHRIDLPANAGRDNVWGIYQLWVRLPPSLILLSCEKNFHSLLCSRNTPAPFLSRRSGYIAAAQPPGVQAFQRRLQCWGWALRRVDAGAGGQQLQDHPGQVHAHGVRQGERPGAGQPAGVLQARTCDAWRRALVDRPRTWR